MLQSYLYSIMLVTTNVKVVSVMHSILTSPVCVYSMSDVLP